MGKSRSIPMKFIVRTKWGGATKSSEASKIIAVPGCNWEMHISTEKHKSNLERKETFSRMQQGDTESKQQLSYEFTMSGITQEM